MKASNNVIVFSEAGKPIFYQHGSEQDVARQCALFQSIRTAVNGNKSLGEIHSIHSKELLIVFMTVGSITLVSISQLEKDTKGMETTVFARIRLETVYSQLIFTLTDQVQTILKTDPSFDLGTTLSASNNLLHGILDESDLGMGNPGPFLVGSVQTVFPISKRLRDKASRTLQDIGGAIPNMAFAILLVGDKLLTIVQSPFRRHQMRVSDLQLVINFIRKQSNHSSSELWVPMCLPRFNSSGFLYSYIKCIDTTSKLCLVFISSHNTTEQFQLFRKASVRIQEELVLRADTASVLSVATERRKGSDDVAWERHDDSLDEEYVTIDYERQPESLIIEEIRESYELSSYAILAERYFEEEEEPLLHFLFRVDIPIEASSRHLSSEGKGELSQCISPTLPTVFSDEVSRRRLFAMYQKLCLRLRLGCATEESSMDALDMISNDSVTNIDQGFPSISKSCPSMGLAESPPNIHGVTYTAEDNKIFLAMNGRGFEL